eukprot:1158053-Pelagomonas_calceolata.AAC.5
MEALPSRIISSSKQSKGCRLIGRTSPGMGLNLENVCKFISKVSGKEVGPCCIHSIPDYKDSLDSILS